MSQDFFSDDKQIIDRNGRVIFSLQQQYSPSIFNVTTSTNTVANQGVNSGGGFGEGDFTSLTIEAVGDNIEAADISSHTDALPTFKSATTTFNFKMLCKAVCHVISKKDVSANMINSFSQAIKDLKVNWDRDTYVTVYQDENADKVTLIAPAAAAITIDSILLRTEEALDNFRNDLDVTIDAGNFVTVQVDSVINKVLKAQNSNGTQFNRTLFELSLAGSANGFTVLNNKVAAQVKIELGLLPEDGLIQLNYAPNIFLHHGFMPQELGMEDHKFLVRKHFFGHNNAKFQVFKKSVNTILFDIA